MDVLEIYKQFGALLKGHFLLSSGNHSDTYLQSARVLEHPEIAQKLLVELKNLISSHEIIPQTICSPAIGGLLAGYELARSFGVRFIFTERVNGVMSLRRGFEVSPNEKVLICEDIITTGGSAEEAAFCIKQKGGEVIAFAGLANRGFCNAILPNGAKSSARSAKCKLANDVPLFALCDVVFDMFSPDSCPLCENSEAIKPGSRGN
ncbi:MAG: orotate phosphoribosyltransferase [Helicobacter sp.]|nr:orotate phosphoribosyltransferase [Helicobacter sp.]